MVSLRCYFFIFVALFILFSAAGNAWRIDSVGNFRNRPYRPTNYHRPTNYRQIKQIKMSCLTMIVDQSGRGNFTRVQAAIDAVPLHNQGWVCIRVAAGVYTEQVRIPLYKNMIYLVGAGKKKTSIVSNGHESIEAATFSCEGDNIIVKALTFINSYNYPIQNNRNRITQAVAARIWGDKSAFFRVGFVGVQDTLWDVKGRHYFEQCTIQGAVDFIFGSGRSLYERCTIAVVALPGNFIGYITAEGHDDPNEQSGFVFKDCTITGNGKAYLGRAWREYSRVLFYNTMMSDIVVPEGWQPWQGEGHEDWLNYDELNCHGPGSDKSRRVSWSNRQSAPQLASMASLSYIDAGSWLVPTSGQPARLRN
ncbi:hypothetical protein CASFOL_034940 [Castilleja foliolosa]|uniref:Pectinesterase n=1 Tax=Castilleja foliolosa TaxID=1961234 RepID=A0ABD3BS26_9LAMI